MQWFAVSTQKLSNQSKPNPMPRSLWRLFFLKSHWRAQVHSRMNKKQRGLKRRWFFSVKSPLSLFTNPSMPLLWVLGLTFCGCDSRKNKQKLKWIVTLYILINLKTNKFSYCQALYCCSSISPTYLLIKLAFLAIFWLNYEAFNLTEKCDEWSTIWTTVEWYINYNEPKLLIFKMYFPLFLFEKKVSLPSPNTSYYGHT